MAHGARKKPLDFGVNPDHVTLMPPNGAPWFFNRLRRYITFVLTYLLTYLMFGRGLGGCRTTHVNPWRWVCKWGLSYAPPHWIWYLFNSNNFGDTTKCGAGRICGADGHWSVLITWLIRILSLFQQFVYNNYRKCTLWRCKSTPTPKAKLLWMTSHYGPTVVRSVTEIPFHVFIW